MTPTRGAGPKVSTEDAEVPVGYFYKVSRRAVRVSQVRKTPLPPEPG